MKKKTIIRMVYVCIFLIISLVPVFAFDSKQKAIGNETKAAAPKLFDESGLNPEFTSEADAYFSQNFGFRNRLVHMGNSLKANLFATSGSSSVVIGREGWLFYESALDDFLGRNPLSDVQLDKIAVSFQMTSDYVRSRGKLFVFTSAPNKMSVYGEYMPYYYLQSAQKSNYERLFERLENLDVASVNLRRVLLEAREDYDTVLYHKKDSHWNNLGAAVAYEAIVQTMRDIWQTDFATKEYTKAGYGVVNDFKGDLEGMLLPESKSFDEQVKLNIFDGIVYDDNFRSSEDLKITTTNPLAVNPKKVVLYRDSFGNALYWFFANDFEKGLFKREIPYNIYSDVADNDIIVAEIVERNIRNLLAMPPVVPSYKMTATDGKYSGAYRGYNRTVDDVIVDVYGNSDRLTDVTETVPCYGSFYQEGLYEITMNCAALDNYCDIYLMLFDSDNGIALYRALPTGKDCDATMYVEAQDMEYISNNRASAYIIALDQNGNDIRMPVNLTLQD